MNKIELDDEALNDLNVFLNRVPLKGNEVLKYMKILTSIGLSIQKAKQNEIDNAPK